METLQADPIMITATKFRKCAETGKTIRPGQECIYYPATKKVYYLDSNVAYDFQIWFAANKSEVN